MSRNHMRAVSTLEVLLVSIAIAVQASPYRSPCSRIGNFSVLVRGKEVGVFNLHAA